MKTKAKQKLKFKLFLPLKSLPFPKLSRFLRFHMGVSKNRGTPKWMVYNGKPY